MASLLLLFAHPALEKSRIHAALLKKLPVQAGFTFHDLYEAYPNFHIDVAREKKLLASHDFVLFQFPLYWFNIPALLKQWMELVLEHGWAYGKEGRALAGKVWLNILSCGGGTEAYRPEGKNQRSIPSYLVQLEQTARICGMEYWPPFIVSGTHRLNQAEIHAFAESYAKLLTELLADQFSAGHRKGIETLNEIFPPSTSIIPEV